LDNFTEKGWAIVDLNLSDDLINRVLSDCSGEYSQNEVHQNQNNRIQDAWRTSEAVRQIATSSRVMSLVEACLGGNAFAFQTLNFSRGTQQPLHSDYYHFACREPSGMCGVWVALEDATKSNGALRVLSGSHKEPYLFPEDLSLPRGKKTEPYEFYKLYEEEIRARFDQYSGAEETLFLKKGQAVVWHANLIHGGSPIVDPMRSRFSQVTHYFKSHSAYFSPIISKRGVLSKSYRVPFDVATGNRAFRHLKYSEYFKDMAGW